MKIYNFELFLLLTVLLFSGCGPKEFTPQTREKQIPHYTKLGLATPDRKITIDNDINANALTGMGYGVMYCVQSTGGTPFGLICTPPGILFGMFAGFADGAELEQLREEYGYIQTRLEKSDPYANLTDIAFDYTKKNGLDVVIVNTDEISKDENQTVNYASLASKGIDTVVEFAIDEIELDELGLGHIPTYIILQTSARLVRVSDNALLSTDHNKIVTAIHPYKAWVENDFQLLKKEFNVTLEKAIASIVDEFLFVYYPTFPAELPETERKAPFYVLKPYYPESTIWAGAMELTKIHERQPLFHWESFPWEHDVVAKERFSDITYELEIYDLKTGNRVYERKELKTNKHQVEVELEKETEYLWRVRARFQLDSRPRVTEWSGIYSWDPVWEMSASWHAYYYYYRFIIEDKEK